LEGEPAREVGKKLWPFIRIRSFIKPPCDLSLHQVSFLSRLPIGNVLKRSRLLVIIIDDEKILPPLSQVNLSRTEHPTIKKLLKRIKILPNRAGGQIRRFD